MWRVRDRKLGKISLEKHFEVANRSCNLAEEKPTSDLADNHFLLLRGLILRVSRHVLQTAWNDIALPVLQKF